MAEKEPNPSRRNVINPRWAHPQTIEGRITDLTTNELGTVTVFLAPTEDGQTQSIRITPFDFLEAREFSPKGREWFIKQVVKQIKDNSRCVVVRWIPPITAGRRH
ncbi:MAG: hypothetical protein M1277_01470 [Patescibacteria group bacterium]|nr:hypothetical protein [Patescibacteria group bacterium]